MNIISHLWKSSLTFPQIYAAVADFFSSGEAIFSRPPNAPRRSGENADDDDEIVQNIKELIEVKIRPMVQEV
jgi:hypothetical protein